jgi:hypothetical protein
MLKTLAGLMQQVAGHAEIDLRVLKANVSQVDRKQRQQCLDIGTFLVPRRQSMNSKRVPVMPMSA